MMFTYGLVKILHIQFRPPNLTELLIPFGDRSPMGLAWAYMGHSKGFGIVLGVAELLVAFLLLFRKTYILGACVGIFVCVNIFAVNLFFDVPVKLFSGLLLLMSIFLVIPDLQRLLQFFLLNQPTQPKAFPIALQSRLAKITRYGMLGLYIVALCFVGHMYYTYRPPAGGAESITPLYGIYNVKHFVKEGDTIPPLTTDSVRWSQLIIQKPGSAQIKFMNGRISAVDLKVDQDKQELVLVKKEGDNSINSILKYKIINEDLKILGKLEEIDHAIDLEKYDLQKFRLINTPFRWINEYPDNK
ncbi:hypothetical protein ACFSQ3_02280 [Sphingobacterium corticis]|uniref:DoxX family protein n=1 Tax=Sphingobacterium corticis TaxID=1812823 RepID=A0ABW5NI94_9SPHI